MKYFFGSLMVALALAGAAVGGYKFPHAKPKPDLALYNAISNVSSHASISAAIYDAFAKEPQINSVVPQKDGSYVVYFTFALRGYGPAKQYKSLVTAQGVANPAVCLSCGEADTTTYQP